MSRVRGPPTARSALAWSDRARSCRVGAVMNLTRKRVDQIQAQGLAKLARGREELLAWWDGATIEVAKREP